MTSKIITTAILIVAGFSLFGQSKAESKTELGIVYAPMFTKSQKFDRGFAFNFSTGIYGKYRILSSIGVGVGIDYQRQNINSIVLVNCDPLGNLSLCEHPSQDKFELIKIPIWLSFNMNNKPKPKLGVDLIAGYGFGKLLNAKQKEKQYSLHALVDNLHYAMIGFELQKRILNKLKLTIGSHVEVTSIYEKRYGNIDNVKIVFRLSK